jgi:transposase-like protein
MLPINQIGEQIAMTDLTNPIFHNEDRARDHLEAIRWPDGPHCPHCGNADSDAVTRLKGKSHRPGLFQCNACHEHFTVTVGSVMERSHIPLTKWVLAFHLMAASKKGVSAHQLMRTLGLGSYRTAWFMAHRVRECMKANAATSSPLGGEGKIIEADETYYGKLETPRPRNKYLPPPTKGGKPGGAQKRAIVALVERHGPTRTFHVKRAAAKDVRDVIVKTASRKSRLHTDESRIYTELGKEFARHETVTHSAGEYVRGDVHTNSAENFFSVFKRGMKGIYQHCGESHLHRYLTEFEFRHNHRAAFDWTDTARAHAVIKGAEGKRLLYRQPRHTTL